MSLSGSENKFLHVNCGVYKTFVEVSLGREYFGMWMQANLIAFMRMFNFEIEYICSV